MVVKITQIAIVSAIHQRGHSPVDTNHHEIIEGRYEDSIRLLQDQRLCGAVDVEGVSKKGAKCRGNFKF